DELVLVGEAVRHADAEDEAVAARQEVGRLSLIRAADVEAVVRTDRDVDLLFPVAVHVTEQEVLGPVGILLPSLVAGRNVLPPGIREGLAGDDRRGGGHEDDAGHKENVPAKQRHGISLSLRVSELQCPTAEGRRLVSAPPSASPGTAGSRCRCRSSTASGSRGASPSPPGTAR